MLAQVITSELASASALRHLVSQSGSGAFQYRTGSPYSGTGLLPASAFMFILILTGCQAVRHSGLKKHFSNVTWDTYTLHVHTVGSGKGLHPALHTAGNRQGIRDTPCTFILLVVERDLAQSCRTVPLAWRAGTTTLCQSQLYLPSQGLRIWLLGTGRISNYNCKNCCKTGRVVNQQNRTQSLYSKELGEKSTQLLLLFSRRLRESTYPWIQCCILEKRRVFLGFKFFFYSLWKQLLRKSGGQSLLFAQ